MKNFLLVAGLFCSSMALASPEIKGTPEVIEGYLNGLPKIISINANAEEVVSSSKARIKLLVETEAKALAEALRENYSIRANIRKKLKDLGIEPKDINESKFSSTPEYGLFGDAPKSYNVTNTLSVLVDSEEKMISVANISDLNKNVRYLSSKPQMLEQEKNYSTLLLKALQLAKEKANLYQKELNVKLVPVYFDENATGTVDYQQDKMSRKGMIQKSITSTSSYSGKAASFGETKLSIHVSIRYKVFPND